MLTAFAGASYLFLRFYAQLQSGWSWPERQSAYIFFWAGLAVAFLLSGFLPSKSN